MLNYNLYKFYKISVNKKLGQHFLLDFILAKLIVNSIGELRFGTTLEIGPGFGILTQALLLEDTNNLIAIEKDIRFVKFLQPLVKKFPGRFLILESDALDLDFLSLSPFTCRIVSNLPYNISTTLIINWLKIGVFFDNFILMLQKEVAQRLIALPCSKSYGRLSVLSQFLSIGVLLFNVVPDVFIPPPKIISSVVSLTTSKELLSLRKCTQNDIEIITNILFAQRRKMLRVSLKNLILSPISLLLKAKILPNLRVENLTIKDFDLLIKLINSF